MKKFANQDRDTYPSNPAQRRALADADMAGDLIKINNETMVMVGLEDETTPPIMSYALKNGIQKSMLIEIPGCGHCPQIQSRDIFVSELLSFLQA